MAQITLKNVPEALLKPLQDLATRNHSSVQAEVVKCLQKVLAPQPPLNAMSLKSFLGETEQFRQSLGKIHLTEDGIAAAKREGRP